MGNLTKTQKVGKTPNKDKVKIANVSKSQNFVSSPNRGSTKLQNLQELTKTNKNREKLAHSPLSNQVNFDNINHIMSQKGSSILDDLMSS